jgi:hypothetical protein
VEQEAAAVAAAATPHTTTSVVMAKGVVEPWVRSGGGGHGAGGGDDGWGRRAAARRRGVVVAGRPEGEAEHGLVIVVVLAEVPAAAEKGGVLVRVHGSVAVHDWWLEMQCKQEIQLREGRRLEGKVRGENK